MNYQILEKFKKYILVLSIAVFLLTWTHLFYFYLSYDADLQPIPWGTVSEGIIWSFPHFNPLIPSSDHNAYINGLLYRSLLSFDQESWEFYPDLADCNLTRLNNIECVLEENIRWSNGNNISVDDIEATYDIIRQTKVHPLYASILEDITLQKDGNSISFRSSNPDINILSLFLQPILPKNIIDTLNAETVEWKLSDVNWVFSWIFTVSNIITDEQTGITRITLVKNENYHQNPVYIDNLIINLFRDESHLLQHRNRSASLNIKYDTSGLMLNATPRLNPYKFVVPQFTSLFYNTQNLDAQLRSFLISTIERENIINSIWSERIQAVYNPFFTERLIEQGQDTNFSFESYLSSQWYYSQTELLRQIDERVRITEESQLFAEEIEDEKPIQKDLEIIRNPTSQKYNFITSDNILIEWEVPEWVSAVFINDYRLQGFSQWDNVFYYRLLENFDSIEPWENKYDIFFEINDEKVFQETFYYFLIEDEEELEKFEWNFFKENTTDDTNSNSQTQISDLLEIELSREEIESLDPQLYYTTNWEAFSTNILSVQTDIILSETLQIIQKKLEDKWIRVNIESMSLGELTSWLRSDELDYDMILLGIDRWYFSWGIYPYFHSSQVDKWYNFSNFSDLWLDILLEELRSEILDLTEREDIEEKILKKIEEQNIIQTLYTNTHTLLIDRNIQKQNIPNKIKNTQSRQFLFHDMFYNETKQINWENKSLSEGIRFIISLLF